MAADAAPAAAAPAAAAAAGGRVSPRKKWTVETKHADGWLTRKTVANFVDEHGWRVHDESMEGRRADPRAHTEEKMQAHVRRTEGEKFRSEQKWEGYTYTKRWEG